MAKFQNKPFPGDDNTVKISGSRAFTDQGIFNSRGFTLVELMVVITIIIITAAIAVPMYISDLPGQKTKAAARNMASDIRLARARAVANNETYLVCLDRDGKNYTILPGDEATVFTACPGLDDWAGPDWDSYDTKRVKHVDFTKNHRGVIFGVGEGVITKFCTGTDSAEAILFSGEVIRFNTRGASVDTTGFILLVSSALYLTNPEDTKKTTYCLHVEGTTGRTRLYEWKNGDWQ